MTPEEQLIIKITPDDITKMDFSDAEESLALLTMDYDNISNYVGKLIFDDTELEDIAPEPADIPEAREWYQELDKRHPYIPYFLSGPDKQQVALYTSMLVPFTVEGNSLKFDKHKLEIYAVEKIQAINIFCAEHELDPREPIRNFCEALHLDVIEEVMDEPGEYPFEPEKINSPFLQDFFKTGYYFHTIDASDEPVLFALVDDPTAVYYADSILNLELFSSEYYPVVAMEMTTFDQPDNPLKMTFVYNIDVERHRKELSAYADMSYITCNFMFMKDGELLHCFTRAIDLPIEIRSKIRSIMLDASNLLRAIPKDSRDFSLAVEELFENINNDKPISNIKPESTEGADDDSSDGIEIMEEFDSSEIDETHESAKPGTGEQTRLALGEEPDILDEMEISDEEYEEQTKEKYRTPYDTTIPTSVLPESIQKITKALSKPVRKPKKNISEELAITPAPKKVVARDEDQLEKTARRLLIMQNNLERSERENIRLSNELRQAQEEIERLRRDNMELENRWWKFWK